MPSGQRRYFDRELETLSSTELRSVQERLFEETLAGVVSNRFFANFYRHKGIDDLSKVRSLRDLRALPVVRKADLLQDSAETPPFGRRLSTSPKDIVNIVESSGTSAAGKEVQALTAAEFEAVLASERVGFVWSGAGEGTVVALHVPVAMTAAGYWWTLALYGLGCNTLRLGGMSTRQRLSYMKSYGVEQMMIGSHYLQRMTYLARAYGYDLRRDFAALQVIFVGGGGWSTETALRWADEWGVVLHEQYGSSQRCIAWTCERGVLDGSRRGVIHFLPQHYVAEVIDPDSGEQVGEGEEGEIVLTLLGKRAMPLVRYGTGDRAIRRSGSSCPCGRAFDGIEAGSLGRFDDMLRVRDRNLWPEEVDRLVLGQPEVLDYAAATWVDDEAQVQLSMRVVMEPAAEKRAAQLGEELVIALRETTGLRFEVFCEPARISDVDSPQHNDGKPRRWTDLRSDPGQRPEWVGGGT
jgi:phenylacetate-CoA ligase